jgi:hypothetical protein
MNLKEDQKNVLDFHSHATVFYGTAFTVGRRAFKF